jgi:hypothetical protein
LKANNYLLKKKEPYANWTHGYELTIDNNKEDLRCERRPKDRVKELTLFSPELSFQILI